MTALPLALLRGTFQFRIRPILFGRSRYRPDRWRQRGSVAKPALRVGPGRSELHGRMGAHLLTCSGTNCGHSWERRNTKSRADRGRQYGGRYAPFAVTTGFAAAFQNSLPRVSAVPSRPRPSAGRRDIIALAAEDSDGLLVFRDRALNDFCAVRLVGACVTGASGMQKAITTAPNAIFVCFLPRLGWHSRRRNVR